MKKSVLITLALALVVLTVGAVGCNDLVTAENGTTIFSQQNVGIWVTGEGSVTVVPDVANLSLGVEARAVTVAQAQAQASIAMQAVIDELKARGVADNDITTQHYSIYPVWDYQKETSVIIGYRVTNTVTVKVRDVGNTGTIIDAVAAAAGDNIRINSIYFTVDDPSVYQEQARAAAMADAKAKALQLADLAGVSLGNPTYISEGGSYIPYIYADRSAVAEGPSTPISPGETEVRLSVQVVYSIS
jgi:uncharacterized protein YggE